MLPLRLWVASRSCDFECREDILRGKGREHVVWSDEMTDMDRARYDKMIDYLFEMASTDNKGYREMYSRLESAAANPLHKMLVQSYFRYLEPACIEEAVNDDQSSPVVIIQRSVSAKLEARPSLLSRYLSGESREDAFDTV